MLHFPNHSKSSPLYLFHLVISSPENGWSELQFSSRGLTSACVEILRFPKYPKSLCCSMLGGHCSNHRSHQHFSQSAISYSAVILLFLGHLQLMILSLQLNFCLLVPRWACKHSTELHSIAPVLKLIVVCSSSISLTHNKPNYMIFANFISILPPFS